MSRVKNRDGRRRLFKAEGKIVQMMEALPGYMPHFPL